MGRGILKSVIFYLILVTITISLLYHPYPARCSNDSPNKTDPQATKNKEKVEKLLNNAGSSKGETVSDLLNSLKDNDPYVRKCAADSLAQIGSPAIPDLVNRLKQGNDDTIWSVEGPATILGRIGQQGISALINTLKDKNDSNLRYRAAIAIGIIGSKAKAAIPVLIDIINEKDVKGPLHWGASYALTQMGQEVLQPLIDAMKVNRHKTPIIITLNTSLAG